MSEKLLLLGNGENYIEPFEKDSNFPPKPLPRTYTEARDSLLKQIADLKYEISKIPSTHRCQQLIFCIRMTPDFIAKTHYPNTLFTGDCKGIVDVGSRPWRVKVDRKINGEIKKVEEFGKIIFARSSEQGIDTIVKKLHYSEQSVSKKWIADIIKIDQISLLQPSEKFLGFDDWNDGKVEIVLHPFGYENDAALDKLRNILEKNNIPREKIKYKTYPNGPTFVSVYLNKNVLNSLLLFNPIRTVHPLKFEFSPKVRSFGTSQAPKPPKVTQKSSIKIGIFDGGTVTNTLLSPFVTAVDLTKEPPDDELLKHGTAVAGAALYGPLNNLSGKDILPTPPVSVESFRVLPTTNYDPELYEIIDHIEDIVPKRKDIKVYNLSLGPVGPILDDDITRFTYALDKLSMEHKVLFVVAVGNDGELPEPLNRIQAPADIVNGLGVGAYSYDIQNNKIRAPYSCVGEGREGCKIKPDIMAFGGCDNRPFHAVSPEEGEKLLIAGTSFASPLVARKIGELIGRCDDLDVMSARALLIHTSQHPNGKADHEFGHGIMLNSIDDILQCSKNSVSVIYKSKINPKNYAKLPVPWVDIPKYNGSVKITWTIALLAVADSSRPDEYTEVCIEDTFYPNAYHYKFKHEGTRKTKKIRVDLHPSIAAELEANGWKRDSLPVTKSGYAYETERRSRDYKWDTVIKKHVSLRYQSLKEPFLLLHGMARNGLPDTVEIPYVAVVTITAPTYTGNLYTGIRTRFKQLLPVRLRAINEIMVPIS
ncbi:MAG: S8 family peptidase [Desulfotomaculum sp.]|nr:S8 family peptidase [Desulfotomaculum sp.]